MTIEIKRSTSKSMCSCCTKSTSPSYNAQFGLKPAKAIYDIGFVHQGPNFRQTNTVAVCEECLAELGKVVAATLAQEREDEDETPISHQ